MGNRDPNDPRDNLTHRYFDWVAWFEPEIFLFENVPGLKSKEDGTILDALLETAQDLGYEMGYEILSADDFEVYRKRKRLFLVGDKTGKWKWPEPTTKDQTLPCGTILDAISETAPVFAGDEEYWPDHKGPEIGEKVKNSYLDTDYKVDPYSEKAYKQVRLDPWKPANTIHASNRHFHPHIARRLTIREEAALQSFHSDYFFYGNESEKQEQVGNAVPPKRAMHLGESIRSALGHPTIESGTYY